MLAQLPLLGFPGSLTIFLLSLISSQRKCSNRGGKREGERWGDRGEGTSVSVGVEGQTGDNVALAIWCALSAKLI